MKTHFPNLDALRFFAALAVIGVHTVQSINWPTGFLPRMVRIAISLDMSAGRAGVNFFFVLSGFLITYLLLEEDSRNDRLNVSKFYLRRILRIWPLYFLVLLLGFVFHQYFGIALPPEVDWRMYVLFLGNFDMINHGLPNAILNGTWSISVEEQFYLVWPWVLIVFGTRRWFPWICALLIGISLFSRFHGVPSLHTIDSVNALSIGAMVAYASFYHSNAISTFLSGISRTSTFIIYMVGIFLFLSDYQIVLHFPSYHIVDDTLFSFFAAFVIIEQNYSPNSFYKFGSIRALNWLGKISYGLYLLHPVAICLVVLINKNVELLLGINILLVVALSVTLSAISYYGLEKRFIDLKGRVG